jgi:hypothetical protein
MRFANEAFAKLWRRMRTIEREIASAGVVYTKETGATTEREPAVKPQPRPIAAPKPKPKPKKKPLPSSDAEFLESF